MKTSGYRLSVEPLESRLSLGDAVLGTMLWTPALLNGPAPAFRLEDIEFEAAPRRTAAPLLGLESLAPADAAPAALPSGPHQTGRPARSVPAAPCVEESTDGRVMRLSAPAVASSPQLAWAVVAAIRSAPVVGTETVVAGRSQRVDHGPTLAGAQEEWAARYDAGGYDDPSAVAVDAAGNVYVTGRSEGNFANNYDYLTIKYDADGNQLWEARYDWAGGIDEAKALAVDEAGNVYVTGVITNPETNGDYLTVKYDTEGKLLWEARYDRAYGQDYAVDLALDAAGDVIVTGYAAEFNFNDYVTIKYNGDNGQEQWVEIYDAGGGEDMAVALGVDAAGNVAVTGRGYAEESDRDYVTVSYDTAGTFRWHARYSGPGAHLDEPSALAVDAAGNVCVTGRSDRGGEAGYDFFTLKYAAADGRQLWEASYDYWLPGEYGDAATALGVDAAGNVYVTGVSWNAAILYTAYTTIKYDAEEGRQEWVSHEDWGSATALAVDAAGDVYVTGWAGGGWAGGGDTFFDYGTVKYRSSDGELLWAVTYAGAQKMSGEYATAIALDAAGNVYVTGSSGWVVTDYATVKYAQAG